MKTTEKSTSTKESFSNNLNCPRLQQIFDGYGQDALQPKYLTTQTEQGDELELVPKMRLDMTHHEWFTLCLDFRIFVLKSFYEML
ncbi:hypothetical protein [Salmonirosea aquatica]|uniref:Uncharacterized protein n=1 Tax=Salmonirosea aquatica TaxID=2654236 RepID=A0A7C9BMB0_9BACT|nr:hypothetical protein [Cytophagaceae bacterium SJW1-29]